MESMYIYGVQSFTNYQELIGVVRPIFEENGFTEIESKKNFSIFESNVLAFWISFNERENCFNIFLVKDDQTITEIDDKLYKNFFKQYFKVEKTFSEKFTTFLNETGTDLLKGVLIKLEQLIKYSAEESRKYTNKCM